MNTSRPRFFVTRLLTCLLAVLALLPAPSGRGEAMLQYFNTSWKEIADKMPELAEAGYNSIWIPPPTKGSGGLSVGYDLWDRFDLGSKDQRGSVSTRYGTEADLLRLIETAHRFGIRVYLDNIMNHNAFDVPGYNESTPLDVYPGFVPEDFHLRLTPDGYYRKWDNIRDYNSEWQVQHLGLADLIDIAQEPGTTNENFGSYEGATFPKIKFLRNPNNPEFYCFKPDGTYVGFGPSNGLTVAMLQAERGVLRGIRSGLPLPRRPLAHGPHQGGRPAPRRRQTRSRGFLRGVLRGRQRLQRLRLSRSGAAPV